MVWTHILAFAWGALFVVACWLDSQNGLVKWWSVLYNLFTGPLILIAIFLSGCLTGFRAPKKPNN